MLQGQRVLDPNYRPLALRKEVVVRYPQELRGCEQQISRFLFGGDKKHIAAEIICVQKNLPNIELKDVENTTEFKKVVTTLEKILNEYWLQVEANRMRRQTIQLPLDISGKTLVRMS